MTAEALALNDAQRRSIGVRLESMSRLVAELRAVGFESPTMAKLEQAMREVQSETRAIAPEPDRSFVQAALAQLWVRVLELRARHMKGYGELDDEAAAYLDECSRRLGAFVDQLMDEHQSRR